MIGSSLFISDKAAEPIIGIENLGRKDLSISQAILKEHVVLSNLEMKGQLQLFEPLKKSQCSNYSDFDWPPFCWLKKIFHDLSFGLMGSFQLIGG